MQLGLVEKIGCKKIKLRFKNVHLLHKNLKNYEMKVTKSLWYKS